MEPAYNRAYSIQHKNAPYKIKGKLKLFKSIAECPHLGLYNHTYTSGKSKLKKRSFDIIEQE
jgi:hypothetical protein